MYYIHRELILEGNFDKAPEQKIKQYIYHPAERLQLKPVQATKIHLVDSISVHSNIKQRTVLPTKRVIVYFLPKSYIAKLSITIKIFTFPLCEPLEFCLILVLRPDGKLSYSSI